jgi:hypothetical protein
MNTVNALRSVKNLSQPILTNTESVLNNVYVSGFLKIVIILYAALAAPQLPASVSKYFHHPMVQIIIFSLIAYTATKDLGISILIAIAFFISFHSYTKNALGKVMSKTRNLFKLNFKEKYMAPASLSDADSLLDSSSNSVASNVNKNHSNLLTTVNPYNEDREINSVPNGLLKDNASLVSQVADAQLMDPYKASLVASSVKNGLAGYNL